MYIIWIKYFFIYLCSFYTFSKLLNIQNSKKINLPCILISISISLLMYFIKINTNYLFLFLFLFLFIVFAFLVYKMPINITVITAILSLALSYFIQIISFIILIPISYHLIPIFNNVKIYDLLSIVISGIIQIFFTIYIFKIKRLRKGMPFLLNQKSNDLLTFSGISMLIIISWIYLDNTPNIVVSILICLIIILGLLIIKFWKKRLANKYIEMNNERNLDNLNKEIIKLKEQNYRLSKIIHKDNKLIPAVELSVTELISLYKSGKIDIEKADALYNQLKSMSKDRKGILETYENQIKLPTTNVPEIDDLLKYMQTKANKNNITFLLSVSCNLRFMTKEIISILDVNTIIADLIENSINALKETNKKNILLNFALINNNYTIEIFDSGDFFSNEVIYNYGIIPTTTHRDSGGTGIGLMTINELIKKYKASIEIDEKINLEQYTKKISINFNNMSKYIIKTNRKDLIKYCSSRSDIEFI